MNVGCSFRIFVASCLTLGILAGCGQTQSAPFAPSGNSAMARLPSLLQPIPASNSVPHADHSKSWILPDSHQPLLFVSDDGTNDVDIFTLPGLALHGQITGFNEPQGLCSDKHDHIWVTNEGTLQIFELSRSGTILETLTDPDGYPVGCAVDPVTGDLTVTNVLNKYLSGSGEVEIYPSAGGAPTSVQYAAQYNYDQIGFRGGNELSTHKGHRDGAAPLNFFVDGRTYSGSFILSEYFLSAGFSTISITHGTIYFPGMVQWYNPGNYLAVGDQFCEDMYGACIYHVKISGTSGRIRGHTTLLNYEGGLVCDMVQGVIGGVSGARYVAGGDYEFCEYANSSVDVWAYPGGGTPTNFNDSVVTEPVGAAISPR